MKKNFLNKKEMVQFYDSMHEHKKIVLVLHPNPDPDSLFSNYAMMHILKKMGKEVVLLGGDSYNKNDFAQFPEYLDDILNVSIMDYKEDFDLLLFMDGGAPRRVGKKYFRRTHDVLVMDHHVEYLFPDDVFHQGLSNPAASSTCEMVMSFCNFMEIELPEIALQGLYAGIFSDTLGFKNATTATTLRVAADIKSKVDVGNIIEKLDSNWTENDFANLPDILGDFSSHIINGKKVDILVTDNNAIAIKKLQLFLMKSTSKFLIVAIKTKKDYYRISFVDTFDSDLAISQKMAKQFNGNGHANRAGGHVIGYGKDQLKDDLLYKIKKLLNF